MFRVDDEYGIVMPQGALLLKPDGTYDFTVWLQASRLGQDPDGRRYEIIVTVSNISGHVSSRSVVVRVPHDQR